MMNIPLQGLEFAINKYLRMDPDTLNRLATLNGKIIRIELRDWLTSIDFVVEQQAVRLFAQYHESPTTIIKGSLFGLIKVARARGKSASLFNENVEIIGDTDTAQTFQEILNKIDIDWEEHLSHFIGDGLAHKLVFYVKKSKERCKELTSRLCHQFKEYIHEEARCFPSLHEIDTFYQSVGQLRDDVDRIEARLDRLDAGKNKGSLNA